MEKKLIQVNGSMMSQGIAAFGLIQLGKTLADHFVMHPWQAMQILERVPVEKMGDMVMHGANGWNFEGLRVVEDPLFPEDRIELRDKDENVLVEYRNVGSLPHP